MRLKMKKLVAVSKEILAFKFKQAYEVYRCKCHYWEVRTNEEVGL